jgi:hypothetical protein
VQRSCVGAPYNDGPGQAGPRSHGFLATATILSQPVWGATGKAKPQFVAKTNDTIGDLVTQL